MKEIEMTKMVEEMDLRNLTPEVDMTDLVIATPDINRPALQLTGYYEHFANERVQIIGYVEFTYLQHLEESERVRAFEEFVSRKIPCVIFTTKMIPGPEILELCNRYQVPAFAVDKSTSVFMAGRCIRRGRSDHGRERNRKERGCTGADQTRPSSRQ